MLRYFAWHCRASGQITRTARVLLTKSKWPEDGLRELKEVSKEEGGQHRSQRFEWKFGLEVGGGELVCVGHVGQHHLSAGVP
eukprot:1726939-Rhodomonas_salina.1